MKTRLLKIKKWAMNHQNFLKSFGGIFLLIMLNMPPTQWNTNEENYLGSAWRRFSPESIYQVSALRDGGYHRFLFEFPVGFLLNHIGFEWTHALGRILTALLYAFSLTLFFKQLRFSLVSSLTILLVFIGLGEQILGDEWLFRGFEAKTLAYPLIFLSFTSLLKQKFNLAYLELSLATYFHFLIGGFWGLIVVAVQSYLTRNIKQAFLNFFKYYILVCIPIFGVILINQLASPTISSPSLPSPEWIYTYFRVPHHVAPFANAETFQLFWYPGILFLLGLICSSVILYRHSTQEEKSFTQMILFLNFYLFFGLLLSYLDKNGSLGKYYLFRPSSVILFLNLCLFCFWAKSKRTQAKYLGIVVLILVSSLTLPKLPGNEMIYKTAESILFNRPTSYSAMPQVKGNYPNYLKFLSGIAKTQSSQLDLLLQASQSDEITLISPALEPDYISFERKYNRPTLVFFKFIPSTNPEILRWYQLLKLKEKLFTQGCPSELVEQYKIRYLLSESNNESINNCGQQIYKDADIKLISINTKHEKSSQAQAG